MELHFLMGYFKLLGKCGHDGPPTQTLVETPWPQPWLPMLWATLPQVSYFFVEPGCILPGRSLEGDG